LDGHIESYVLSDRSSNWKHFHHLIAEVVDDFDGDAAGGGCGEGAGDDAGERFPGFLVCLGIQGGFQGLIGIN
jgi:hypothetical protein